MTKSPIEAFEDEVRKNIFQQGENIALRQTSVDFIKQSAKYSYNFSWLGRPIIQYPQDIIAMQELVWRIQPDLIIETGIAHGGSLIFLASMLELNAICGGPKNAQVLGIDIDIREHNRKAIEGHPMSKRVEMIQGSSIDSATVKQVGEVALGKSSVLLCLDSNHTHSHVLAELKAYSGFVTKGSYCIVFDTAIEDMPKGYFQGRPWDKGNNPKTAVWEFLKSNNDFKIDKTMEHKLMITVAPDGFLQKI